MGENGSRHFETESGSQLHLIIVSSGFIIRTFNQLVGEEASLSFAAMSGLILRLSSAFYK